jgi:hypothetical protein
MTVTGWTDNLIFAILSRRSAAFSINLSTWNSIFVVDSDCIFAGKIL